MPEPIEWFELDPHKQLLHVSAGGPRKVGTGFERVLGWARDAVARPHDRVSSDLLRLECSELAGLLTRITEEDGDTRFLTDVLHTLVMETARRETHDLSTEETP